MTISVSKILESGLLDRIGAQVSVSDRVSKYRCRPIHEHTDDIREICHTAKVNTSILYNCQLWCTNQNGKCKYFK